MSFGKHPDGHGERTEAKKRGPRGGDLVTVVVLWRLEFVL